MLVKTSNHFLIQSQTYFIFKTILRMNMNTLYPLDCRELGTKVKHTCKARKMD